MIYEFSNGYIEVGLFVDLNFLYILLYEPDLK
jgi:hypothetical protein